MNNIADLIKVSLLEDFKLNKLFKRKNIVKIILISLLGLFLFASVLFTFGFIYYGSIMISTPENSLKTVITMVFVSSSLMLIITNLTKVGSYLFKSKDFEILMSMPLSYKEIIISKISSLLIINYITLLLTSLPAYFVIGITISIKPMYYFNFTLALLFLPLLIIAVMALLSYFLSMLFAKIRIKNIVQIVLAIIAVSFYMVFILTSNSGSNEEFSEVWVVLFDKLKYVYPVALLAINGITVNTIYLLVYIVINVLAFIIFINVVAKFYLKMNTGFTIKSSKHKELKKQNSLESNVKTITKLEFKKYFNNTNYVLNTIMGKIMFLIFTIGIYFSVEGLSEELAMFKDYFGLVILVLGLFSLLMTSTTASSISLEGKNIWFYKSLPIKLKDLFISKILVDFLVSIVIAVPTIIIAFYLYKFDALTFVLLLTAIILVSLFNSTLGLVINLKFPKLDWDLEIKAIKQSLSVFLHMIIGFILTALIIAGIILYLKYLTNVYILMLLVNILILLVNIVTLTLLKIKGSTWFLKL